MTVIDKLKDKVLNKKQISKEEALSLIEVPLDDLTSAADEIRRHFCGNSFDACTIINVKSGECGEDCKFCAQSIHYNTDIDIYPLLSSDEIIKRTEDIYFSGFKRISYVASGRSVTNEEFDEIVDSISELRNLYDDINLCVSLGLLTGSQIKILEDIGVDRVHNNLESSCNYFKEICTTHTYREKLDTLDRIDNVDIKICSGGIFGLGETFEDRIDLGLKLREYGVKSIPINILNPIKNTPYENNEILSNDEVCRIIALYRFINPESFIRMAGGRLLLPDNGRKAFMSGSNAAIRGDMLTTDGVQFEEDLKIIKELGYEIMYTI